METTIKLAIETYSNLSGMNETEIAKAINGGDSVILNSVLMLMEGIA